MFHLVTEHSTPHTIMAIRLVYTLLHLFLIISVKCSHGQSLGGSSPFADLTVSQVDQVVSYLMKQSDLNLVSGDEATINSSYIYAVELLPPPKAAVLQYLDHSGPRPTKKAKVLIFRGDIVPPVVEDFAVFPIPNPTQHSSLQFENIRNPAPYYSRTSNTAVDEEAFLALLEQEIDKVDHILFAITGLYYANCSDDSECLTWTFGGPPDYNGSNRSLILTIHRDFESWELHPIGLECLMLMPGVDPSKWTIVWVSFRGMSFSSFDAMSDYFTNVTPKPDRNQPVNDEELLSAQYFRGTPRPAKNQRGPQSVYPDGARYSVNNNHVEWMGWSLDFGVATTSGPRLFDIRFLGDRIVYELSLQEGAVYYSGLSAMYAHTKYFDSFYNMGTTYSEMFPGVDCPANAHFADTVHVFLGEIRTFKNTVCVFELDRGVPLRRHFSTDYEGGFYFYSGIPDNVLVVRSIQSVDNYDYLYDFMFHQGGQIEVKVSLSGYILADYYYTNKQDKYGFQVGEETSLGAIHSHSMHFKVDLDIQGMRNRFKTLDIGMQYIPDPLDDSKMIPNKYFNTSVKVTEKEAAYKFDFATPKYLVMYSEDSKNRFGNSRGYRILNQAMWKQLEPEDSRGAKSRSWGEYQVSITKRKESEGRSSSPHIYMDQNNPAVDFQDFLDDDENILDEDLVAWVTVGTEHIPIAEDAPIVQTIGAQPTFILKPFNYFDSDPSFSSRDTVRVEPGDKEGQQTYYFAGVPADKICEKENISCEGNVGTKKEEKEKTMKECPTVTSSAQKIQCSVFCILIVCLYSYFKRVSS